MRVNGNTNKIGFIIIGLVIFLVALSPVYGQIEYGRPASGGAQFFYSHWSLEDSNGTTEINQLTIPVKGFIPIRDNLEALFYVAHSSNDFEYSNAESSLSGLGDARLQLNRSFSDDQLLLSVGVNLPSGKKKLNRDEELPVLRVLSQNYLSFPMRRFGKGFGFNVLLGGAQMLGELRCGAGIMYQHNGSYSPYQDTGKYDPGDFISVNAGADWQKEAMTFTFNAVFTTYADDQFEGNKVFAQSTQFGLNLAAAHDGQDYDVGAGIGYLLRGRNTFYDPDKGDREGHVFGNEFEIRGYLTRHLQQSWYVTPSAELKLVGANDLGFGSSTIFGFGAGVGRTFSEQVGINFGGKYFIGNADGGAIDLTGFQLTASLTANL